MDEGKPSISNLRLRDWAFLSVLALGLAVCGQLYAVRPLLFAAGLAALLAIVRLRPGPGQTALLAVPLAALGGLAYLYRDGGVIAGLALLLLWAGATIAGRALWERTAGRVASGAVAIGAVAAVMLANPFTRQDMPPARLPTPITSPTASPMDELLAAADGGDADAQYVLATMHRNGEGVGQDLTKAFDLAKRSADQGNPQGQRLLGLMYRRGDGTAADPEQAARNFEAAANQGDPWAQAILGAMFVAGDEVPQSNVEAYKWLSLAASQGNAGARSFLDAAQDTFTAEELAAGQIGAQSVRDKVSRPPEQ